MKSGESGRTDGGLPLQSICQLKTIVIWTIPICTITKFILSSTNIWPKIIIAVFPLTRPTLFQHTTLLFWSLKMQYRKSKSPTLNKITHKFIKFQSRSRFFFSGENNKEKSFSYLPTIFFQHVNRNSASLIRLYYICYTINSIFLSYQILIMLMPYKHDWQNWSNI